jgi:hypothetical protein
MAWFDDLVPMLRNIIGDYNPSDYTYTDVRLQELLVVAAQLVIVDVPNLATTYSVDITQLSISPDPTSPRYDAFINFMVLKAACMTDEGLYRSKALASGIKAKCGPAVIETMGHIAGFKDLITFGPCKAYATLKYEFIFGNPNMKAVLGPFVSNTYYPPSYLHDHRHGCV